MFDALTDFLSGGKTKQAAGAAEDAAREFEYIDLPDITKMQLELEMLVQQGVLTPEEAQVHLQESSQMAGISTDPKLRQAQMDALRGLQEITAEGGLTASDRANLNRIATEEATRARGQREAVLQSMEARGAGGSGASLLAQLQNAQESASRKSQRDLDVAGMAQDRALQALMQSGQLGGQIEDRDFGQQAAKAQAQDMINQFNTNNMNQIGLANTQARNDASAKNLAEKQRIDDTNVATKNQQQVHNKGLLQTNFDNKIAKAGGVAGGKNKLADVYTGQAAGNTNTAGSLIQSAAMAYAASDKNLKEDIEPFDASAFLDSLTPSKYRYKKPEVHGEGEQVGVMAQDVEKEAPQMVEEGPDGKYLNYNKAGGPIFASLADIHQRLKNLEGK